MLELPEAITISKQANALLVGKTVTQVFNATKPNKFTFYNGDPLEYGKLLSGRKIESAEGFGMFVDLLLSGGMRLSISDGVIPRYYNAGAKIPSNYQLLLTFDDNSFLAFSVAMYGSINAFSGDFDNKYYRLSHESISPLSDKYTAAEFDKLFAAAPKNLTAKALLATEQRIPGVGNGATQDILFNAGIHPKQKVAALPEAKREVLFNSLKSTLAEMTSRGGRDTQTDLLGNPCGYRTILSAKTWKNPCPRCGATIAKEPYLGGSVYYCPVCQALDTSRIL
jgi:formamidopyrimidine-DNA glycosylase